MVNYVRLEKTAQRLIKDNGKAATIIRKGAATGPEWDPQPGADTEHAALMVETGYSLTHRDSTLIQAGDKLGLMSTSADITPAMSDTIRIDGDVYNFVDLKPFNPGGTTLFFELQARR